MTNKDSAQNVIDSYRKRQEKAPIIFGISAVLLILGAAGVIFWLLAPEPPPPAPVATETAAFTATFTATVRPTETQTPTITPTSLPTDTPEPTLTPTAAGPFIYTVAEGDNLQTIATRFGVDLLTILALNPGLNPNAIFIGQDILIPAPDTALPTATVVPLTCRGVQLYTVKSGDNLGAVATLFYSTIDAIMKENELENANAINAGDVLEIPCGIATPAPTWTPALSTPGAIVTLTPVVPTATPTQ